MLRVIRRSSLVYPPFSVFPRAPHPHYFIRTIRYVRRCVIFFQACSIVRAYRAQLLCSTRSATQVPPRLAGARQCAALKTRDAYTDPISPVHTHSKFYRPIYPRRIPSHRTPKPSQSDAIGACISRRHKDAREALLSVITHAMRACSHAVPSRTEKVARGCRRSKE